MMNRAENRHSWPNNGLFTAIFVLSKMVKTEQIDFFRPAFAQKFSMIILSNIFKNKHF